MDIGAKAKEIIRVVAPGLGQALGGPLGGLAAREIAGALLGDEAASMDDLAVAIEGAGSEQLAELAKLDREFAARMKELGIEKYRVDADDRASARQRQATMKDWTPAVLGALVVLGFFGLLVALMFLDIPTSSESIIKILVGVLGTVTVQVMNFFFGSSAGSSRKNDILAEILDDRPSLARSNHLSALRGDGGLY